MRDQSCLRLSQIDLIHQCEEILKKILQATDQDHMYGRGFASYFPNESLAKMEIMRMAYEMELEHIRSKGKR